MAFTKGLYSCRVIFSKIRSPKTIILLPRHAYFRTKRFNTMYLHPKEDGKNQNLSCEKLLDSEVSPLDLTDMLNFLKSGRDEVLGCVKPIEIESAALGLGLRRNNLQRGWKMSSKG